MPVETVPDTLILLGHLNLGAIRLMRSTSPASRCFQIDKVADGQF
ncbi:hypothetical protein CA85_27620 [Allorhodopirellula solitaria]|uniref:Uncharacterized protein n=1 Tax=Allorhodopirellula solitaria TaxID=2527987 RepID=A0A5C5XXP9_9BACT|nr:hypothetical protein CA85_27620 [Allorhodopirellula solitaria]